VRTPRPAARNYLRGRKAHPAEQSQNRNYQKKSNDAGVVVIWTNLRVRECISCDRKEDEDKKSLGCDASIAASSVMLWERSGSCRPVEIRFVSQGMAQEFLQHSADVFNELPQTANQEGGGNWDERGGK
jgi:hypothetical protein